MRRRLLLPLALPALLLSAACRSTVGAAGPDASSDAVGRADASAPMDVTGRLDSPWEYVAARYDADGDGRVSAAEHGRRKEAFARLDRDGDGVLSRADFEEETSMAARMRGMRAQLVVARSFQADDDPGALALEELERSIEAFDTDGDGALDRAELEAGLAERPPAREIDDPMLARMMANVDPWAALAASVDSDGDDRLAAAELERFFRERDDGDLVWRFDAPPPDGSSGAGRTVPGGSSGAARTVSGGSSGAGRTISGGSSGAGRAVSGVPEGALAPDFTLPPPDGGEPVTLSSFRGERPVALIFGSYT